MGKSIRALESHTDSFVTVAELADYWLVSRKQIYKQIKAGTLPAVRIGPRLLRIRTADAFKFESSADQLDEPLPSPSPTASARSGRDPARSRRASSRRAAPRRSAQVR